MKTIFNLFLIPTSCFLLLASGALANGVGGGNGGGITLNNPLGENDTIMELINSIITALRNYIAPPIVTIMVLYGGFQMLFAGGEPEKFTNGRKTILYAVVGYAIILVASGITLIIQSVLGI